MYAKESSTRNNRPPFRYCPARPREPLGERVMRTVILLLGFVFGVVAAAAPPTDETAYETNVLDVKFKDGTTVRFRGGRPTDVGNDPVLRSDLQGILRAFGEDGWSRTHSVDESA